MSDDERKLIRKAQDGDVASFEALVRAHQDALYRVVVAVAGNADDAQDALQETLLQAYRSLPGFRGDASFATWIHRIALNATRNWVRREARASSVRMVDRLQRLAPDVSPGPEELLVAEQMRESVRGALLALPDHYRDALLLRHYRDMTYEQIAEVTRAPVGTVRSRIAEGRRILVRKLGALGLDFGSTPR